MQILKLLIERYLAECQLITNTTYFEFVIQNSRAYEELYVRNNVLTVVYRDGIRDIVDARLRAPGSTLSPLCWNRNQLTNLYLLHGTDLDLIEHPFWHRTPSERSTEAKRHFHIGHLNRSPITVDDIKCLRSMWHLVDTRGLGRCLDGKSNCILTDEVTSKLLQSYQYYLDQDSDTHNFYTCRLKLASEFHAIFLMSLINSILISLVNVFARKSAVSDTTAHFLTIMTRVLTLACFGITLENIANQILIEQMLLSLLSIVQLDSNRATLLLMTALCYQNNYFDFTKILMNLGAATIGNLCVMQLEYLIDYFAKTGSKENESANSPKLS